MPHQELFIDGVWYPSVTTIMDVKPKPWLDAWRDKWGLLAARKTRIANAIGTEFHRCVEQWLDTGAYSVCAPTLDGIPMPSTMTRVDGMVKSWVSWAVSIEGEIKHTELQVVSKAYTYSGTLDAVGTLYGNAMLFDWKTSSRIYDDMQLQLSAYAQAYNEELHRIGSLSSKTSCRDVKDGIIVCTSKDKPHFRTTTKQFKLGKTPFKKFLKLRAMFDEMQTQGQSNG